MSKKIDIESLGEKIRNVWETGGRWFKFAINEKPFNNEKGISWEYKSLNPEHWPFKNVSTFEVTGIDPTVPNSFIQDGRIYQVSQIVEVWLAIKHPNGSFDDVRPLTPISPK